MTQSWETVAFLLSLYCLAQIYRDMRRGSWVFGGIGAFCLLLLWVTPLPSGPVSLTVFHSPPPAGE